MKNKKVSILGTTIITLVAISAMATAMFFAEKSKTEKHIEIIGSEVVKLSAGSTYEELGFKAYDDKNKNYEDEVIIESNLDINTPGEYQIKYKLGEKEVIRTVIVEEKIKETHRIVLEKVNKEETIYLKLNDEYKEPGYKVKDSKGKDITATADVKIENKVDSTKTGKYIITYKYKSQDDKEVTARRNVVVIDNKLELSLVDDKYTNASVRVNIEVTDNYFDYILTPSNEKIKKKEHTYSIDKNGVYKFVLYNKKGLNIEKTIEIKNIDKEKPIGTCEAIVQNEKTIVKVNASDNIGIKKYMIGQTQYTTNEITLSKEITDVSVDVYDNAENKQILRCTVVSAKDNESTDNKNEQTNSKNNSLSLSKSITSYTKNDINITVKAESSDFNYIKLPNGNKVYEKNYTYKASTNGTYKFVLYTKSGVTVEKKIVIKNIDKEKPTGTCKVMVQNGNTTVKVNAKDNIELSKYIIDGFTYTTNEIDLLGEKKNVSVDVYDSANNKANIACKVINKNLTVTLSPSIKNPTNTDVSIIVNVESDYFSYIKLPNGIKVSEKNYTYKVSKNGTYTFAIYDKDGTKKESSITINNIDKEKPTGTCDAIVQNGKTTVKINASDNKEVKKYIIGQNQYTTNEIDLLGEKENVSVDVYDSANNKANIACKVINKNLTVTLSKSVTSYTNSDVNIIVKVESEYFSYIKLPEGTKIYEKTYAYKVSKNGTYKFEVYDKDGTKRESSITINNIDNEPPTGSCSGSYKDGVSTININASDNIGISKYVIDGTEYTNKNITINKEINTLNVTIYDKVGNTTNISCPLTNQNIQPAPPTTNYPYYINSITGIRYSLYSQADPNWANNKYYTGATMEQAGCMNTSAAVLLSSYDSTITPLTIFESNYRHDWVSDSIPLLSNNGFTCKLNAEEGGANDDAHKAEIVEHIKKGYPAVIRVHGKNHVDTPGISNFTTSQHYMALIDYDSSTDKIFIGNSSSDQAYKTTGWYDRTEVLTSLREYNLCTPSPELLDKYK